MAPAEGGPKILKVQSSWHRRRRSKTLAVSLKHWKGRRGGWHEASVSDWGGVPPPAPAAYGRSDTSLPSPPPPPPKTVTEAAWAAWRTGP